jgi:uncharacterized protein YjbJ (UPF0337 family)
MQLERRRGMARGASTERQTIMVDRDMTTKGQERNLRATGNDLKGRAKDAVGGLTNNREMQAEGKLDKIKSKVQHAIGDVQRKVGMRDPDV